MHELPKEYMDDQYSLLEELIKRANAPQVEAKCTGDEQSLNGAADQMRE